MTDSSAESTPPTLPSFRTWDFPGRTNEALEVFGPDSDGQYGLTVETPFGCVTMYMDPDQLWKLKEGLPNGDAKTKQCGIAGCEGEHGPGSHNTIIEAEIAGITCTEGHLTGTGTCQRCRDIPVIVDRYHKALYQISQMDTERRPDGTFNYGREAIIDIARRALNSAESTPPGGAK